VKKRALLIFCFVLVSTLLFAQEKEVEKIVKTEKIKKNKKKKKVNPEEKTFAVPDT